MVRNLIYILIIGILFSALTPTFAQEFPVGDEDIYRGVGNYQNILKNARYKDIDKSFAKDSIIKLTILGTFKSKNQNFKPKAYITKRQTLLYIGRILGLDEEEYMDELRKLNVLTNEEYEIITKNDKKPGNTTREEVALWIGRSIKLEEKLPNITRGFRDYTYFSTKYLKIIESFIQQGYMNGYQDGYFKPKHYITKEELAKVLDNALDDILLMRDFKIKEGEIDHIKRVVTTEGDIPVIKTLYYMKNKDNTYPIIYTSKSRRLNLTKGFPVYNNGRLQTSDILDIKDTIKYYVDYENNVICGEIKTIY